MKMAEKRISDLHHIKTRFLRSAHLERDFYDPAALSGYIKTDFIQDCCDRLSQGLRADSGRRAWRVTGNYGSGKSSFALLVATALSVHDSNLPPSLVRAFDFKKLGLEHPAFLPVLVTCSREPISLSILRAIHETVSAVYKRGAKSKCAAIIEPLLDQKEEAGVEELIKAIVDVNSQIIADGKGGGLLLVVDELGKFLEFAALRPHQQDVFLLQRLAEVAARSANKPLFLLCFLHQGFNAYASDLDQSAQREWEKVAGRFDEIIFNQPIEQTGHLISSTLDIQLDQVPKDQTASLRHAMKQALDLGWFGSASRQALLDLAGRLYPLHPTVLPVLVRVFRRFGQNERSLFSFLSSNEPFGLRPFSNQPLKNAETYRLSHLFDYVRTNFGHKLSVASYRSHWSLIESVVESFATDDPLHLEILKTVGLLNLVNDDLLPTAEAITCAVAGDDLEKQRRVTTALQKRLKGTLYDRGKRRGFCLWPHSSVDLEAAYEDARRAVQVQQRVGSLVQPKIACRTKDRRRSGRLRPQRLLLKPQKGWKMPPETISVAAPSKWANHYAWWARGGYDGAAEMYRNYIARRPLLIDAAKCELRGKNLACRCPIGQPCHADFLLEVANAF
jgi:hypothetical protein